MPLIQPDLLVRDALRGELGELREIPAALGRDVFEGRPESEKAEIREWFASRVLPVELGFPLSASALPGFYVFLGPGNESDQVIGSTFGEIAVVDMTTEEAGTLLMATIHVACWAQNADAVVWMSNVALWALLRRRAKLTGEGLMQQRLQVSDFAPMPEYLPDHVFRRDVTLAASYGATVLTDIQNLKEIGVTATAGAYETKKVYGKRR